MRKKYVEACRRSNRMNKIRISNVKPEGRRRTEKSKRYKKDGEGSQKIEDEWWSPTKTVLPRKKKYGIDFKHESLYVETRLGSIRLCICDGLSMFRTRVQNEQNKITKENIRQKTRNKKKNQETKD